ncbi:MAG: hypothetical protein JNL83_06500 [Myxococcales bacterium]|nr:hypothetical protein [Myxococcales bacterium]
MWRALLAIVLLAATRTAEAAPRPCGYLMQYATADGFADILVCDGVRHRGISVKVDKGGTLLGVYWTERQGKKERNYQLHADGTLGFVVVDGTIDSPKFSAKARTTQYQILPRGQRMWIDAIKGGLVVHDAGGHSWHLVATPIDDLSTSYRVAHVERAAQSVRPIEFTEAGLVGVDLAAAGVFFLQHRQPSFGGYADRTTRAYREMTSIFHDEAGNTCAVANAKVMVANPNDPKDKTDMAFRFTDDAALDRFLADQCPKLDRSPLQGVLEQRR